jgi:hypothetical protein
MCRKNHFLASGKVCAALLIVSQVVSRVYGAIGKVISV